MVIWGNCPQAIEVEQSDVSFGFGGWREKWQMCDPIYELYLDAKE